MAKCLQVAMASCWIPSSSSSYLSSSANSTKRGTFRAFGSMKIRSSAKIPKPPINYSDPFMKELAALAAESPEMIHNAPKRSDNMPYLHLMGSPRLMATPAEDESFVSSDEHSIGKPPPDLASRLLQSRIVYIGLPLVPAVTAVILRQLLYLKSHNPKEPIYLYINSTGTTRDDFVSISGESSGFAIYDLLMALDFVEICTVGMGFALGQACLLLASGTKGKRFMFPDCRASIQEPRVPASGLMPASTLRIRAREAMVNRQTFIELLAMHTGNSEETIDKLMRKGIYYMDGVMAKEFGVIDQILVDGTEKILPNLRSRQEGDEIAGFRRVHKI